MTTHSRAAFHIEGRTANLTPLGVAQVLENTGTLAAILLRLHPEQIIEGFSPLQHAVRNGLINVTAALLNQNPELINAIPDAVRIPLLHMATHRGNPAMLNLLLEHERSANINIQDNEDGRTPLQIAITRGNVQAFNTLLEHGADPEIADYHQERALHFAVEQENPEFLTRLLAIDGIDINPINYMGDTPLHTAAEVGNTHTVAILLRQGDVDVNVTTPQVQESEILEGFTPLHRAAENGHWDTAIQLLEAGANPLAQNHYGDTPSVTARGFGHHALADAIERYSVLKFKGSYVVEDQQQQILGDFRPFEERFVEALEQAFARGLTALLLADIQTFLSRKGF